MEYEKFSKLVSPGKSTITQSERLRTIWKKAPCSIGCESGRAMEFEAEVMVEQLQHIREIIRATDSKIEEICLQFPEYNYLLTIPGFGPDVSSKILGAIGDPFRFRTRAQVVKMAGLDLSAERSGNRSDTAPPLCYPRKGKLSSGMPCIKQPLLPLSGIVTLSSTTPINYVAGKRRRGLRAR